MQGFIGRLFSYALLLLLGAGIYYLTLWLHGIEWFPKAANELDALAKEIAIFGAVVTLVAALFAVAEGHNWLDRFYDGHRQAQGYQKDRAYADLDEFYMRILNIAIEKPYLRKPRPVDPHSPDLNTPYSPYADLASASAATIDPAAADQQLYYRLQYDANAFMVWNFLETIHDRCEKHPDLLDTWAPIVAAENEIHRGWFLQQMREQAEKRVAAERVGQEYIRSDKFCREFQVFIFDRNFVERRPNDKEPLNQYRDWTYKHPFPINGVEQRDFKKPPTVVINGRPEEVWPREKKAGPTSSTTLVPVSGRAVPA